MPGLIYTDQSVQKDYRIQLANFEGPLDLLLFLIRKNELDIYDIPIAEITRQYLEYVELMKELDLEVAGEFILMAATLIQIKVRMLLPRPDFETEEDEEDPRAQLVRQLLEYKRFKEVAETLTEIEDRQRRLFARSDFTWQKQYHSTQHELVMKDVGMFDLMAAFKKVLDEMPRQSVHEISTAGVTIEEQIEMILQKCREEDKIRFDLLMQQYQERVILIVTFMAILELIRTHRIIVKQASVFGEIWIMRR